MREKGRYISCLSSGKISDHILQLSRLGGSSSFLLTRKTIQTQLKIDASSQLRIEVMRLHCHAIFYQINERFNHKYFPLYAKKCNLKRYQTNMTS